MMRQALRRATRTTLSRANRCSSSALWLHFPGSTATTTTARSVPSASILRRHVWSTSQTPPVKPNALCSLTPEEITQAASLIRQDFAKKNNDNKEAADSVRFVSISLAEAPSLKQDERIVEAIILDTTTGLGSEISLSLTHGTILSTNQLGKGVQPLLTPDDCDLAESISKASPEVQRALAERYGITDMSRVAADPWSVHLAGPEDVALANESESDIPRRLVQTFLYQRVGGDALESNHYAHPIDILPIVDLNTKKLVRIDGLDRQPPPKIPQRSVNYHRDLLHTNSYLQTTWREDALKALDIVQPEGPSFRVTDTNHVQWQNWDFDVGFNYREGLVLHNVQFDGRSVVKRLSLVEMAVPYADPNPPFSRKCAFDVGDYGLGFCANSLELGCDCLGHIHYFDAALNDSKGNPYVVKKAICMHEEDDGILWKHVEYRNGHNEARRARELVISMICTVVNYEYLFYIRFKLNGEIEYEIRLSGELSTNLPSQTEDGASPSHGVMVAPGVNSQIHQHSEYSSYEYASD